jgi:hypothetical protein
MAAPWNPPTPIDKLFTQLDDGIRFATAGNDKPSDPTVIRLGYNLIHKTGLFEIPCRDWRNKPEADKTRANFNLHFRAADQDRRLTATAGSAGYHGANAAQEKTQEKTKKPLRTVTPPPVTDAAKKDAPPPKPDTRPQTSYCWSHGFLRNPKHTSLTCQYKAEGHCDAATATNTLGGSTAIFVPRTFA